MSGVASRRSCGWGLQGCGGPPLCLPQQAEQNAPAADWLRGEHTFLPPVGQYRPSASPEMTLKFPV